MRYKWNINYKHNFFERLNDAVGRMCMCDIQNVTIKGKVDETVKVLCTTIRRAGRGMEIHTWLISVFILESLKNDKQHEGKKREFETALKDYKGEMMRRVGADILLVRRNM
jgi:hypothetical protein